jgi:tRNA-Thr(GGU) m(6)t(6)A37 methyltransferase TsaA
MQENRQYTLKQIGIIRTPYQKKAPHQPVDTDEQEFYVQLDNKFVEGLMELKKFNLIYLIFFADRIKRKAEMIVSPPWAKGKKVGVFASRSPVRPNPIGLSIVRIKKIVGSKIYTSGLDVFDKTPLLDIKPYIKNLDNKDNANSGWIDEMDDKEHLSLHIKGIPHDY